MYVSDENLSDEEMMGDFVVDDRGKWSYVCANRLGMPVRSTADSRRNEMSTEQISYAMNIFGEGFAEESVDEEDEEEMLTELSPEELREERFKALRKAYEPSVLQASFATERDEEIRNTDVPERFQLRMPGRYSPQHCYHLLS